MFKIKPKIFVVDDNKLNRKILSAMIKKLLDCVIFESENGEEAFEFYKKIKPDLIFMDVHMPVIDGFESIRLIRDFEIKNNIFKSVIYILSADPTKIELVNENLNAIEYLVKPISIEKLKGILEEFGNDGK